MAYTEIDEDNLQYYSLRSNKSAKLHFYNDNKKMNFVLDKLAAAGIEVVSNRKEYQWMKEQIDEINITLEMLEEKPMEIQRNEKKEIENLSTSNNDTQARSQSLNL